MRKERVAVIGAGVSGLTCATLLAEDGYKTTIFADEAGKQTTSAAAGAIWFPYDVEPLTAAIAWSLQSYDVFDALRSDANTGVSLIELRTFCRNGTIGIPPWATKIGAHPFEISANEVAHGFSSGFVMHAPLIDTTIYLPYLRQRFITAGGQLTDQTHLIRLEEVRPEHEFVINCAGIGAQSLVPDPELEPHRGQVVIVPKLDLDCAVVCDDPPLMYAIPRTNDCLFGGTNDISNNRQPDPHTTAAILAECSGALNIDVPTVLAERVGLRPFRRTGIRLEAGRLGDGRTVIHNYGHGGAGFTLSWGCAQEVLQLVHDNVPS